MKRPGKKRDIITEIMSISSRQPKGSSRWVAFSARNSLQCSILSYLKEGKVKNKKDVQEIIRGCIVGMVASLEGYFRLTLSEIIDSGGVYRDNLKKLKDLECHMDVLLAIETKEISLGQFVSHLVPLNRLEDINAAMSYIIDKDFLGCLSTYQVQTKDITFDMSKLYDKIYGSISEIFRLRHIFAHELAVQEEVLLPDIGRRMRDLLLFVYATEYLVGDLLRE